MADIGIGMNIRLGISIYEVRISVSVWITNKKTVKPMSKEDRNPTFSFIQSLISLAKFQKTVKANVLVLPLSFPPVIIVLDKGSSLNVVLVSYIAAQINSSVAYSNSWLATAR